MLLYVYLRSVIDVFSVCIVVRGAGAVRVWEA